MSVREVGSYIGFNRVTSTSQDSASGIWSLAAVERRMRAAAWPPPAGDDPDFASVALLLHMDGSNGSTTFTDSGPANRNAVSGAQISTTQSKFGGASGAFNLSSNDQHIRFAHDASFTFGASDKFVIEMWYYPTSFGSYNYLASKGEDGGGVFNREWAVGVTASSVIFYRFTNADISYAPSATVSLNTWTHLAWACDGSTVRIYQDGALRGSTSWAAPSGNGSNKELWIGKFLNYTGIAHDARGYIDDLRITKGTDRGYTGSTITVPTAAYPDQ